MFLALCNAIMDEVKDTRGSEGLQGVWASDSNNGSEEEEEWLDVSEVAFVDDVLSFLVYDTGEEVEVWATRVIEPPNEGVCHASAKYIPPQERERALQLAKTGLLGSRLGLRSWLSQHSANHTTFLLTLTLTLSTPRSRRGWRWLQRCNGSVPQIRATPRNRRHWQILQRRRRSLPRVGATLRSRRHWRWFQRSHRSLPGVAARLRSM